MFWFPRQKNQKWASLCSKVFSPAVNQLQSPQTFEIRLRVQDHIVVPWDANFSPVSSPKPHDQTYLRTNLSQSPQILPWHHQEMLQNTSRDVLWTLEDVWQTGRMLNQTQSRRSRVLTRFILESDQTWQLYLLLPITLCSSEGPTWFRSAPFTWNDQLWCQSSPRQQGEPEADVTTLKWQK